MSLAPIVLFVYNRPQHTLKTLEALMQNELAEMSELFIFCDGPKADATKQDQERINKVRDLVKKKNWCKKVTIRESHVNKGLADSIVAGVTEIVNTYGKIIVLEDDIVTAKGFLKYMNDALDLYENEPKVMQISGFMIPKLKSFKGTYLYRAPGSWGWATWKNRWNKLIYDNDEIKLQMHKIKKYDFNINDSYDYFDQLNKNINGVLCTWAVKWYLTIYLNEGLCLLPAKSMTRNIGFDGTGENCEINSSYSSYGTTSSIKLKKKAIMEEDKECLNLFINYYKNKYGSDKITRIKINILRILNNLKS